MNVLDDCMSMSMSVNVEWEWPHYVGILSVFYLFNHLII